MAAPEHGADRRDSDYVEVAYALPDRQTLIRLPWPAAGMTAGAAIEQSGIRARHPEIDLAPLVIGVFGTVCDASRPLQPGDRVEIYRPLRHDPREMRRARAATATRKGTTRNR
jgi:putative ubiquitin-RnfH superfamily antitoxin RatB of RatAB toxin-antitoxin module